MGWIGCYICRGRNKGLYTQFPTSREAHIKAIVVNLEAAKTVLPSPLCADPMFPLASTLVIFKATLSSESMVPRDKDQVTEAGD